MLSMETLNSRIKSLRKEKGLTQLQLAEMLYVTDKAISKWEVGEANPDISLLPKLAEIFNVTIDFLFNGKSDDNKCEEQETNPIIKVSTGNDLVNIYFQPSSETYCKTIIELFLAEDKNPGQLIGKYKVDEDMMFKSISGLARGNYAFKLYQYDNKGNLLIKTDYQYFKIG